MAKILLLIFSFCSLVYCQGNGGDLRTNQTDTIFIRVEIRIESEEFISIKNADILGIVLDKVKSLNITPVLLADSETDPEEFLKLNIYLFKNYFTVIAEYNRKVLYKAKENFYEMSAPTWRKMIGGGHGSEKKFIMDVASDLINKFVSEFKNQNSL